jgi:hypothetical protein
MDEDLTGLLGPVDIRPGETKTVTKLRIREDNSGEIEVQAPDGPQRYMLKPLSELYGAGTGGDFVDPQDERFMPLMMPIEEEIADYYAEDQTLTDGAVLLALKPLAMSPESEPADELGRRVQVALRLALSLNNFSRQQVRQALRHVTRSVERHTKAEGRRGYLEFISRFFRRGR